jgi:beta-galactosidase
MKFPQATARWVSVIAFGLALAVSAGPSWAAGADPRVTRTINHAWTFSYLAAPERDDRIAEPGFDDSRWPAVALPHTWSTYETTGELHPFIRNPSERDDAYWWYGWGWYRKRFELAADVGGRRIFLEFDGVQKYSRVYLNGTYVGEHKGGYTSFSLDITPHVNVGRENILAVAVSNRRDDLFGRIPPMTAGNWNVYGGIYRDVRLVLKEPVHLPYQGNWNHDGGTFITTPEVSERSAIVDVKTWARNDSAEAVTAIPASAHQSGEPRGGRLQLRRPELP